MIRSVRRFAEESRVYFRDSSLISTSVRMVHLSELPMKSGRDEAARGSIPGSSPRPDREHRKPQPTTCYTVLCVKTAVEISEESRIAVVDFLRECGPTPRR